MQTNIETSFIFYCAHSRRQGVAMDSQVVKKTRIGNCHLGFAAQHIMEAVVVDGYPVL